MNEEEIENKALEECYSCSNDCICCVAPIQAAMKIFKKESKIKVSYNKKYGELKIETKKGTSIFFEKDFVLQHDWVMLLDTLGIEHRIKKLKSKENETK